MMTEVAFFWPYLPDMKEKKYLTFLILVIEISKVENFCKFL
jgi:hypothetical protein